MAKVITELPNINSSPLILEIFHKYLDGQLWELDMYTDITVSQLQSLRTAVKLKKVDCLIIARKKKVYIRKNKTILESIES